MPQHDDGRRVDRDAGRAGDRPHLPGDVPAVVWTARASPFRFTSVSPYAEPLLGHPRDRWLRDPHFWPRTVTHPDDRGIVETFCRSAATGDPRDEVVEHRAVTADGDHLWLRTAARIVPAAGPGGSVHGVTVEVTGIEGYRAALRETRECLRLLGRAARDVTWELDVARGTVEWNERAAEAFGLDAAVLGETLDWWLSRVHPDDRARVAASFRAAAHHPGDEAWTEEYRLLRGDGGWGTFLHRGFLVRDAGGAAVRGVGTLVDLTPRRTSEQALRASEERYRAFVELNPDGVWCLEFAEPVPAGLPEDEFLSAVLDGGYLAECNDAFARMHGRAEARDLAGTRLRELFGEIPEQREALIRDFYRAGYRTADFPLVEPEGRRHFSMDAVGIVTHDRLERIWGTQRDVTKARRMENTLAMVQKMEAVGRLAGGIAHDFNNILTVIKGSAEMLLSDLPDGDDRREDAREIVQSAERAASLTRQLLAFSRQQVMQPERMDLGEAVRGMERMLRRLIPENVELRVDVAEGGAPVEVDAGQITQVMLNLAVNASDAMPGGGRLEVRVGPVTVPSAAFRAPDYVAPGEYAELHVRDSGTGMDADTLKHIFEPFFTTKGPGKGTGLGLSTVYGIVKQSGGFVWAESRPNEGTDMVILLPLSTGGEGAEAEPERVPAPAGAVVLVVEDEEAVRTLAVRILERAGYTVAAAASPAEALVIAASHPGPIRLLLTDVVMPGLSGPEVAERLRPLLPSLRVLFMSGYSREAVARHGVLEEGARLLEKPFSADELLKRVEQALGDPVRPV